MNSKHEALKGAIRERLRPKSDREKHIEHTNSKSSALNKAMVTKGRHERRHMKGHRTSLGERKEFIKQMSKE